MINQSTLLRGERTENGNWLRCLAVLLMVSIFGCGTVPAEKPAPYRLASGAKIALGAGRFDPTVIYIEYKYRDNIDLGKAIADCITGGDARARATVIPLVPILLAPMCLTITPMFAGMEAATGLTHRMPRSVTVDEHKSTVGTVPTRHKAAMQALGVAMESFPLQRLLLERVQRYALERGIPELAILPGQATQKALDQPKYKGVADYVFEISVTALELSESDNNNYWVRFHGQGRLLRVDDNVPVDNFSAARGVTVNRDKAETSPSAEVESALQELVESVVDQWIGPMVKGIGR